MKTVVLLALTLLGSSLAHAEGELAFQMKNCPGDWQTTDGAIIRVSQLDETSVLLTKCNRQYYLENNTACSPDAGWNPGEKLSFNDSRKSFYTQLPSGSDIVNGRMLPFEFYATEELKAVKDDDPFDFYHAPAHRKETVSLIKIKNP